MLSGPFPVVHKLPHQSPKSKLKVHGAPKSGVQPPSAVLRGDNSENGPVCSVTPTSHSPPQLQENREEVVGSVGKMQAWETYGQSCCFLSSKSRENGFKSIPWKFGGFFQERLGCLFLCGYLLSRQISCLHASTHHILMQPKVKSQKN